MGDSPRIPPGHAPAEQDSGAPTADIQVPRSPALRFGGFEVIEKLGEGGMGAVYKARDTRLDRIVAIKIVSGPQQADAIARKRLFREARAAARIDHPNICTVYSVEETEDSLCIAMQYVEGATLKQQVSRGPVPLGEFLDWTMQIAAALGEAHRRGVVHRDIKPANLMVTSSGQIKVLDFGVAHLSHSTTSDLTLNAAGTTSGTLSYMAPEQLRGQPADQRSDLFSLGVVMYELLTGKHPFVRELAAATMRAILSDDPAPLASLRSDVPAELAAVVAKALAKDPAQRYQAAQELFTDLDRLAGGWLPAERRTALSALRSRTPAVRWAAGIAAALVLAGLVWSAARLGGGPSSGFSSQQSSPPPAQRTASPNASAVPAAAATGKPTIAVLAFSNAGKDPALASLEVGIAEALTASLVNSGRYLTIERTQLDKALEELKLGRSEYVDPATAQKVGRVIGAQYMIIGSFQAFQGQVRINARLMRVETAEIVAARNLTGPLKDALQLQDRLAREFLGELK